MSSTEEIMNKTIKVIVNIKIARLMLDIAGYQTENMSDNEVFNLALSMNEEYGVKYEYTK